MNSDGRNKCTTYSILANDFIENALFHTLYTFSFIVCRIHTSHSIWWYLFHLTFRVVQLCPCTSCPNVFEETTKIRLIINFLFNSLIYLQLSQWLVGRSSNMRMHRNAWCSHSRMLCWSVSPIYCCIWQNCVLRRPGYSPIEWWRNRLDRRHFACDRNLKLLFRNKHLWDWIVGIANILPCKNSWIMTPRRKHPFPTGNDFKFTSWGIYENPTCDQHPLSSDYKIDA